ncbi:MAG: hypothetical protein ACRDCW_06690 [Sarcina sp.]
MMTTVQKMELMKQEFSPAKMLKWYNGSDEKIASEIDDFIINEFGVDAIDQLMKQYKKENSK